MDGNARFTGLTALIGGIVMLAGAGLWIASGTDLDHALAAGTLSDYLTAAAEAQTFVVANLTLWIAGVFILGMAGTGLASLSVKRSATTATARLCYWTAVPLAITSFVAWLALVVQLPVEPTTAEIAIAEVVGWFASRADWIATVLIVGAGPFLISLDTHNPWIPGWLVVWGWLAALAGLLSIIALFAGGLTSYGFLIVPVGLGWTIAAGIVLLSRSTPAPSA